MEHPNTRTHGQPSPAQQLSLFRKQHNKKTNPKKRKREKRKNDDP
jgi:hypothetical protein